MTTFLQDRSGIGVHQRRKVFEMRNQYELSDDAGQKLGAVEQVEQSPLTFIVRLLGDMDVFLPVTLSVSDAAGGEVLRLHKPWFKYAVTVTDGSGTVLGVVRKRVRLGKAVFTVFAADGTTVLGEVKAENWRARNFRIDDATGTEVARVTKQWRGLLTEAFTDADSYAVTFESMTAEPMRSLALASALSVDLTMKQKDY
ncbi:MAG: hypothetical protein QOG87_1316 [Actinomycetota bacterium]|jgi:uncharacterized protein YxjI